MATEIAERHFPEDSGYRLPGAQCQRPPTQTVKSLHPADSGLDSPSPSQPPKLSVKKNTVSIRLTKPSRPVLAKRDKGET